MKNTYKNKRRMSKSLLFIEQNGLPLLMTVLTFFGILILVIKIGFKFQSFLHLGIFLIVIILIFGGVFLTLFRFLLKYFIKKYKK